MLPGDLSRVLTKTHKLNLATFQQLLTNNPHCGRNNSVPRVLPCQAPFWDIVVLTAGTVRQMGIYEYRIQQKMSLNQIPRQARYHVVVDRPKSKMGSGGSTCVAMKFLRQEYPAHKLEQSRVLLIHAGGFSSRLPHVSTRGKIFTTLPQAGNDKGIDVLELKLVLYLHLLATMPPGVFLTSADGIELLASKDSYFPSTPHRFSITALAHPSTLDIGSLHGVFQLDLEEQENGSPGNNTQVEIDAAMPSRERRAMLMQCKHFLHKPSKEMMRGMAGVVHRDVVTGNEVVYTDSSYYFGHGVAEVMARACDQLDVDCDLEAWADVLSHFGEETTTTDDEPSAVLGRLFQESGVQLHILVINASKFYHLGTMQEFAEATCKNWEFMTELQVWDEETQKLSVMCRAEVKALQGQKEQEQDGGRNVPYLFVENSTLPSASATRSTGAGSILVDTNLSLVQHLKQIQIPANTCMYTLTLGPGRFVTFTFSTLDDMKKLSSAPARNPAEIDMDEDLHWKDQLCVFGNVKVREMLPLLHDAGRGLADDARVSLWTAPIFEVAATAQESIEFAIRRLHRIQGLDTTTTACHEDGTAVWEPRVLGWVSMQQVAQRE